MIDNYNRPLDIEEEEFSKIIEDYKSYSTEYLVSELYKNHSRYKAIFENSPISLWEEDFSEIKILFDNLRAKGITDLNNLIKDTAFLKSCISKMVLLHVNNATFNLFECSNYEELIESFNNLGENSLDLFRKELINFFEGNYVFEAQTTLKTLKNSKINVLIKIIIPEEFINDWQRVYVSVVDITDLIKANTELIKAKEMADQIKIKRDIFITNTTNQLGASLDTIYSLASCVNPNCKLDSKNLNEIKQLSSNLKSLLLELMQIVS